MTEYEIVQAYRLARDKKEQIRILCDMTLLKRDDIMRILRKHAQEVPEIRKQKISADTKMKIR